MKSIKRAPSKKAPCKICGKIVHARGLKSHIRLLHALKITEVFTQVIKTVNQPIGTKKLLKLVKKTSFTKSNLSKEIEIPIDYSGTNTSNYSSSRCDGCNKITGGITECSSPNEKWLLYLCRKCKDDHRVMVNLAIELTLKSTNCATAS